MIKFKPFKIFKILLNNINHQIAKKNIFNNPQLVILSFDHIGLKINLDGRYENDLLLVLKEFIKNKIPNSNNLYCLDIGANIGNHSVFFSEFFREIYAFEPNPLTYEILKINSKFASKRGNITPYKMGLSNKNGKVLFRINNKNIGGSSIIKTKAYDLNLKNIIDIQVSCADNLKYLEGIKIGCIKIDIEGHELEALMGAEKIIKRNKPLIIFEQEKLAFRNGTSEAINYLKKIGYTFYTFNKGFYLGEKRILKYISFIMNTFLDKDLYLRKTSKFHKKYYEMIVAINI